MNPKTKGIFEAAFAKWGFESQVLVLSEEASESSAACSRFLNHKTDISKVAEEAADVEIMIEQLSLWSVRSGAAGGSQRTIGSCRDALPRHQNQQSLCRRPRPYGRQSADAGGSEDDARAAVCRTYANGG